MSEHSTESNLEKLVEWLINDRLYQKYLQSLKDKSDSRNIYFSTTEDWKEYKANELSHILGKNK